MDMDRVLRIIKKFEALAEHKRERAAAVYEQYKRLRLRNPEQALELLELHDDLVRQAEQIERLLEGEE